MKDIKDKILAIICIIISLTGCDNSLPERVGTERYTRKNSKITKLFTEGFHARLKQIYLMSGSHTIPIMDIPADSLFTNNQTVVNLPSFQTTAYTNDFICAGLSLNDTWYFDTFVTETEKCWETGYGENWGISCIKYTPQYVRITTSNEFSSIDWMTFFNPDGIYTYRGIDNHLFEINMLYWFMKGDTTINSRLVNYTQIVYDTIVNPETYVEYVGTNLKLDILTDKTGKALGIDNNEFYFDTNAQVSMNMSISSPLTGDQVKQIVNSGVGFELYPTVFKGTPYTAYRIGNNLYIPRYNSYVYIGATNAQGMILPSGYQRWYYRLRFEIINY